MLKNIVKILSDSYEPTKTNVAENAIRDMFLSKQYNKKVSVKDIKIMLKSASWHKAYGKEEIIQAWKNIVDGRYVNKKGDDYVWGIEDNE